MAIKTNSGNVKHVYVKDKGYATEVKKSDGTIIWEEYVGTFYNNGYNIVNPNGVSRSSGVTVTCTATSNDPAVETRTISNGSALYNKDVLTFDVSYKAGYSYVSGALNTQTIASAAVSSTSREPGLYANGVGKLVVKNTKPSSLTIPTWKKSHLTASGTSDIDTWSLRCTNTNDVSVTLYYGNSSSSMTKTLTISANATSSVITSWNKKLTAPTYYGYFKYQYYDMGSLQTITSSTSSF
jgi:hypothetical protein